MAYCSKCGKRLHYSVKQCEECGSTLIINDHSTFDKNDPMKRHGRIANPFKRGNIGWATLGFFGALLVVVAPALYFLFWKTAPKRAASVLAGAIAGYVLWVLTIITALVLYWYFPAAYDTVIHVFTPRR